MGSSKTKREVMQFNYTKLKATEAAFKMVAQVFPNLTPDHLTIRKDEFLHLHEDDPYSYATRFFIKFGCCCGDRSGVWFSFYITIDRREVKEEITDLELMIGGFEMRYFKARLSYTKAEGFKLLEKVEIKEPLALVA